MMIFAQLVAFVRVHRLSEEGKEKRELKTKHKENGNVEAVDRHPKLANGYSTSHSTVTKSRSSTNGSIRKRGSWLFPASSADSNIDGSPTERYSSDTSEESEIIL